MDEKVEIIIGTRGSKLALWQANHVLDLLTKAGFKARLELIETKGDKILDRALSKIGSKGVFTEELEEKLREGAIHLAVHSAKDLQSELHEDFEILAFMERENAADVLVSYNKNMKLNALSDYVIGTSSTRRVATIRHYYPKIKCIDVRGNLQTRLKKLEAGYCDALLLAYAGVHRMGYGDLIAQYLPFSEFLPAVGQGSIAVECSKNLPSDIKLKISKVLLHWKTEVCIRAERAFLKKLQGGCSIPVFGYASFIDANTIQLECGILSLNGKKNLRTSASVVLNNESDNAYLQAENMGLMAAEQLLSLGADQILKEIRNKKK